MDRRLFLDKLARLGAFFFLGPVRLPEFNKELPAHEGYLPEYTDLALDSHLTSKTVTMGSPQKDFLLSTTGGGVALIDYDNDGWLDIFILNGWGLGDFSPGAEPTQRLYRNNRDRTFTDVTHKAGLVRHGWGQGVCVGDYDNDGFLDLFVTYYGKNVLYHNNGNGTFSDVTKEADLDQKEDNWNTGAAFLDYDRNGHLDLFVSNYVGYPYGLMLETMTGTACWISLSSGNRIYARSIDSATRRADRVPAS